VESKRLGEGEAEERSDIDVNLLNHLNLFIRLAKTLYCEKKMYLTDFRLYKFLTVNSSFFFFGSDLYKWFVFVSSIHGGLL